MNFQLFEFDANKQMNYAQFDSIHNTIHCMYYVLISISMAHYTDDNIELSIAIKI